jgi:competence protein ComEA
MTKLFNSLLAGAGIVLLLSGQVQAKDTATTPPAGAAVTAPTGAATTGATTAGAAKAEPLDLNSASEKDLATLPQIGEARSKAIVKSRPYQRKDELVSKKILSQSVYDGIKDSVVARQAAKK